MLAERAPSNQSFTGSPNAVSGTSIKNSITEPNLFVNRYLMPDELTKMEISAAADEVIDTILGAAHAGRIFVGNEAVFTRGPLKERTFHIPDALIEDYLEKNIARVAQRYVRQMAPDVELSKAFGSVDMQRAFDRVNADYDRLLRQIKFVFYLIFPREFSSLNSFVKTKQVNITMRSAGKKRETKK